MTLSIHPHRAFAFSWREARLLGQTTSPDSSIPSVIATDTALSAPEYAAPVSPEGMHPVQAADELIQITENECAQECQRYIDAGITSASASAKQMKAHVQSYLQTITDVYTKVIREPAEAAGEIPANRNMPALFQEMVTDNVLHNPVIKPYLQELGIRVWHAFGRIYSALIPPPPCPPAQPKSKADGSAEKAKEKLPTDPEIISFTAEDNTTTMMTTLSAPEAVEATTIDFRGAPQGTVTPDMLSSIQSNAVNVRIIDLSGRTEVSNNLIRGIPQNLRELRLSGNAAITKDAIENLPENLTKLEIGRTGIQGADLRDLAERCKRLQSISLNSLDLSSGLSHLATLSNLQELHLHEATIDQGDAWVLGTFAELQYVDLRVKEFDTVIIEPVIESLLKAPNLKHLLLPDDIPADVKAKLEESFSADEGVSDSGYSYNWKKKDAPAAAV